MCLLLVALDTHPDYELVVAANRDEFHERPADPADFWDDQRDILGGRDRQGMGTWLAVNRRGAFAAITNVRMPGEAVGSRSRGLIISDFLSSSFPPSRFVENLAPAGRTYSGFNIIASRSKDLAWYSNFVDERRTLGAGVYGLSNHLLDTPWPKVRRLKHAFDKLDAMPETELVSALFDALASEQAAPDPELPATGLDLAYERILSPIFINGDHYGTRCSTVILIDRHRQLTFIERRFGPHKTFLDERTFRFEIDPGAT
ncbi:MAG: NRDE family protein [Gammaproteobacteria bacterium]|jgi:uncharacterized protein with NRDE domain